MNHFSYLQKNKNQCDFVIVLRNHFYFLGWSSCIIVAGAYVGCEVEVLIGENNETKQLPNLPQFMHGFSMVQHNGTILLCGGMYANSDTCLQLDNGTWKDHSTLNEQRIHHSTVTTQSATFVFGGIYTIFSYEYLPKDSTTWVFGRTDIPGGFAGGCAIAVKSEQEIWLIGGFNTDKRIMRFNVNDHTFEVLFHYQLNVGRYGHRCAFLPNTNKIMITGGYNDGILDSTEILDIDNGSIKMTANPMNSKRSDHGMGIVTINDNNRLVAFGGNDGRTRLTSVESYNSQTEIWETTNIKLKVSREEFGFLTVKLNDIISNL